MEEDNHRPRQYVVCTDAKHRLTIKRDAVVLELVYHRGRARGSRDHRRQPDRYALVQCLAVGYLRRRRRHRKREDIHRNKPFRLL